MPLLMHMGKYTMAVHRSMTMIYLSCCQNHETWGSDSASLKAVISISELFPTRP